MSCVSQSSSLIFSHDLIPAFSTWVQNQITVRIVSTAGVAAAAENGSDAVMAGVDEDAPGPLLTALQERDGDFDFSMTNPPFFSSEEEVRIYARVASSH